MSDKQENAVNLAMADEIISLGKQRDEYKNHFEACEAQRQRQLVELESLRKDLCKIAEGCGVGHPDIEESKRRIIAIREERDELRAEVERLRGICLRLEKCVAEGCTKDEAEFMRADKARLDWLELSGNYPKMMKASERLVMATGGGGPFPAHTWREAIDAAIAQDQQSA